MKFRPFASSPSHERGSIPGRISIFLCLFTAVMHLPAIAAAPGDAAAVRVARFESDRRAAIYVHIRRWSARPIGPGCAHP